MCTHHKYYRVQRSYQDCRALGAIRKIALDLARQHPRETTPWYKGSCGGVRRYFRNYQMLNYEVIFVRDFWSKLCCDLWPEKSLIDTITVIRNTGQRQHNCWILCIALVLNLASNSNCNKTWNPDSSEISKNLTARSINYGRSILAVAN